MVAWPSVSLAMQVPQLPASQLNGGFRPARRALSNKVSPGTRGTDTFLRSRWIVTVPGSAPFDAGSVTRGVSSVIRGTVTLTAPFRTCILQYREYYSR